MFPARAGMSRIVLSSPRIAPYVPRASGDEPARSKDSIRGYTCSPRERG